MSEEGPVLRDDSDPAHGHCANKTEEDKMTVSDAYGHLRAELTYEAERIEKRAGWSLAAQAFLFLPLLRGVPDPSPSVPEPTLADSPLYPTLPIIGLLVSVISFCSIFGGILGANVARDSIQQFRSSHEKDLPPELFPLRPSGVLVVGLIAPFLYPILFLIIWAAILVTFR